VTRPRRAYGANPPGRLAAAMVRALAAELSDPGRFSRAKEYARDGAVVDIEVEPGSVSGHVQGSRYEPYVAVVHVAPADDTASLLGLIPDRDELMAECTCPDDAWRGFCKHAVATLLVLADEATAAPDVLETWRSGEPLAEPEGEDAGAPAIDVLAELLAAPAPLPELPAVPPRIPVAMAAGRHTDDVAAVLADALSVLRSR
jgi:SWIM zinc finger